MIKPGLRGESLVNERSLKTKLLIHSWLTGKKYACSEKTELDQKVKAKAGLKMKTDERQETGTCATSRKNSLSGKRGITEFYPDLGLPRWLKW